MSRPVSRSEDTQEEPAEIPGTPDSARPLTREKRLEEERLAALEALRESRTFLMDAQRLAGMGSWTRDLATGTRSWSDEMYKLTGLDRSSTLDDATVDSTIHPDDLAAFRETIAGAEKAVRTILDVEFRLLSPGGSLRYVHCRIRIEYDAMGNPLRHFGILQDITSRHRLLEEKLELERRVLHAQKLESLGVLAGGIAHDFNNVLMGILGNADLVLGDLSEESPLRPRLLEVVRAASHAAELTRQMLAYSGMGSFVQRRFDPDELVSGMRELLQASVSKSTVLVIEQPGDLPRIHGDPAEISQVLMNLVINASESYDEAPGTVRIATGAARFDAESISCTVSSSWKSADSPPPPGEYFFIEVSDNGCGMPEDVLARVFDPFFSTKFAGRGLGMAVLLGIVRSHAGMVSVLSRPGEGSTFRVLFPAAVEADVEEDMETVPEQGGPAGGTVLVVDDEETVRSIVRSMLERAGYEVLCASDGLEAVEVFRERQAEISCVILDLTMPRMTGEECFRRLRELRPEVRVLVSSGYEREDVAGRFRGNELAGFIQKPYRYADLSAAVLRAVNDPARSG